MSRSTSEEKKNPVITLKAQAENFNFSMLRADKGNAGANSGATMYVDLPRMKLVINEKNIDKNFINQLYVKHASLIEDDKNGEKNYRPLQQVLRYLYGIVSFCTSFEDRNFLK